MTVDLGFSYEASACLRPLVNTIFPKRRRPLSQVRDIEHHRARDASNREITSERIVMISDHLNLIAPKRYLWMVLGVQKIGAPQVSIPIGVAAPNAFRVDRDPS